MSELHIYDFDGTLFRSPHPPDWWGEVDGTATRWWDHSRSLDHPCVPLKPSSNWWVGKAVQDAKKSISNPNVWAVLCSGRGDNTPARWRVPELLKHKGLTFDQIILSPSFGATPTFKTGAVAKLIMRHPHVTAVHIWEDDLRNIKAVCSFVEKTGRTCTPHIIKVPPHEVACDEQDLVGRVASRWVTRLAAGQRTSGVLQAPPELVDELAKWCFSVVAANRLRDLKRDLPEAKGYAKKVEQRYKKLTDTLKQLQKLLTNGASSKVVWEVLKEASTSAFSQFGYTALGGPDKPFLKYREFNKAYKEEKLEALVKPGFKEVAARIQSDKDIHKRTLDDMRKEMDLMKSFLVTGYTDPMKGNEISRTFKITDFVKGWRYADIIMDPGKVARMRLPALEKHLETLRSLVTMASVPGLEDMMPSLKKELATTEKDYKDAKKGVGNLPFDTFRVILTTEAIPNARAFWQPQAKLIKVHIPSAQHSQQWSREQLKDTLRHELQHTTQTLLQDILGNQTAGLPGKKLLTPDYKQWMRTMGPGKTLSPQVDEAMKKLREQGVVDVDLGHGRSYQRKPKDIDFHALDDIEFFTRLQDAINALKHSISQAGVKTKKQKNNAIDLTTGVIPMPNSHDRDWADQMRALGGFDVMRDFTTSGFFKQLKAVPVARKKYLRAVLELRKELGYTGKRKP